MADLAVIVCVAFDHRACPQGLQQFKDCIFNCHFVQIAMEVSGTFDLIVQGRFSSLAEYTEQMELIRPLIAEFATRIETNFISKHVETNRDPEDGGAVWLPCEGGRKQIDAKLINKIVAEGDYMRVHVGDWDCLIHLTMNRMCQHLAGFNFIKLNRSCLVRIGFIDRVLHDERRWMARLWDGTQVSVAKSHVHEVLRMITDASSHRGVISSNRGTDNE